MKKLLTSAVVASSLFSGVAFAETDGIFAGVNFAYGTLKIDDNSDDRNAYRYGIVGGYKQFFTEEFGARYYVNIDTGTKYTNGNTGPGGAQVTRFDIGVNADALYNFLKSGDMEYGVFAGLSLDYANNKQKFKGGDASANGLDLGVNFGLRAIYAEAHGVELTSRFGFVGPEFDGGAKATTPYSVGLRYTFSF
ncbi:hypothetical protein DMB92_01410 [Campylobacter sp. MIT 99-7217]|uniref:outer membrane beta-barrel protein n=1 Tax=Campylobacter sp. MIT 99-7217 TaxID=535091 RepID=UPI00115B72C1|nr:outer membrane beta-barrel protein [Campylobacter sp. MIT 99-7217]TQR34647.1 hypothetical protein DMB92_01410 [Campylobacter sp. MIT 99-7217]